jgi:hypothetical protein
MSNNITIFCAKGSLKDPLASFTSKRQPRKTLIDLHAFSYIACENTGNPGKVKKYMKS